jgi:hypothetical protein
MALDLPALFKGGAATAFAVADSVMIDAVLEMYPIGSITISVYDPVTDAPTVAPTSYNVRGLMYKASWQKQALDSADLAMFMIQYEQAKAAGLTTSPDARSFLVIGGTRWSVISIEFDPANALYIFNLRRT